MARVSGCDLEATYRITCRTIASLCINLSQTFNTHFDCRDYQFVPEYTIFGGILMWKFPGKTDDSRDRRSMYKSMRMGLRGNGGQWPHIRADPADCVSQWLQDDTVLWTPPGRARTIGGHLPRIGTIFITSSDAPHWTKEELGILQQCLGQIGLTCKGPWPSVKSLRGQ